MFWSARENKNQKDHLPSTPLSGQIENLFKHILLEEPHTQEGFCSEGKLESRTRNRARGQYIRAAPILPAPYLFPVLQAAIQKNPTIYTHPTSPEVLGPEIGFVKAYQSHITNLFTNESQQVYRVITLG